MPGPKKWFVDVGRKPAGPFTVEQIRTGLERGKFTKDSLVYGPGMTKWEPLAWVPEIMGSDKEVKESELPRPTYRKSGLAHDIDFRIVGDEMQFVEIELDPGESVIAEAGAMMYMNHDIEMETIFGDGTKQSSVVDKLLGAGKRLLTGESLFMTVFNNTGTGKEVTAFSAPYPGKIIPMNLAEMGGELVCQKDAFLCAAKGIAISIHFQKKIGTALFGGEGFIMQSLRGDGLAFVHAGGTVINKKLAPGEELRVDSGCIVAMEPSVDFDIKYVGSVKSAIFGGEGFFFATLKGPGDVWLQSLPFSRLAGKIHEAAPPTGNANIGEGSLGGLHKGLDRFF